jgi:putative MFS transporter
MSGSVVPAYAAHWYPQVFAAVGVHDAKASIIGSNAIAFLGALAGVLLIERAGRRRLLLASFWVMVVTLLVIGVWGSAPGAIVVTCFVGFAFFNALSGDLTGVYPA